MKIDQSETIKLTPLFTPGCLLLGKNAKPSSNELENEADGLAKEVAGMFEDCCISGVDITWVLNSFKKLLQIDIFFHIFCDQ